MADKKTVKRQAPQQKQPGGPRRWISLLFYVLAFAFMGYYFFGDKEGQGLSKEVSYTNLTKYIEAGVIDKIEVKDDLMATAKVKPQNYTVVFNTQGDGERAKGAVRTQVPSIEEISKYRTTESAYGLGRRVLQIHDRGQLDPQAERSGDH